MKAPLGPDGPCIKCDICHQHVGILSTSSGLACTKCIYEGVKLLSIARNKRLATAKLKDE